ERRVAEKGPALGARESATLTGQRIEAVAAHRGRMGLEPGFAMVDTCAAEFAARTPYFYATYAAAGSPPEAGAARRPGAPGGCSGSVRRGPGRGRAGGRGQSEPPSRPGGFRRPSPPVLRAARRRERAGGRASRDAS